MKYVALLRGINVGGNNKVAMSDLRACFEQLGFTNVSTYINSGNILFEAAETDEAELVVLCEKAIEETFGFPVVTTVISKQSFKSALSLAPIWWGSGGEGIRNEALFVIPPTKPAEVLSYLQKKSESPDKFAIQGQVIFWSLPKAEYNKSVVPKIIGTSIYKRVTIRSSTTTKKILALLDA